MTTEQTITLPTASFMPVTGFIIQQVIENRSIVMPYFDEFIGKIEAIEEASNKKAKEEERERIVRIINIMIDENHSNMKISYEDEGMIEDKLIEAITRITNQ